VLLPKKENSLSFIDKVYSMIKNTIKVGSMKQDRKAEVFESRGYKIQAFLIKKDFITFLKPDH